MTRKIGDLSCADCGTLMKKGKGSLPQGHARCHVCRRKAPSSRSKKRPPFACSTCGGPKWSDGERPCRNCAGYGSRQPRACEACGITYKPTHSLQRACGRACGLWFHRGTILSCPVDLRTCLVCLGPYTSKREHSYGTCSPACQIAASGLFRKPKVDPEWRTQSRECPACGDTFTNTYTTTAIYCTKRCARRASKLRRRVREAGSYGEWTWSDFMRMARKFKYCCAYCGEKPERLDPDHVVPLSKGGPNIIGNILPTCADCNSDKQAYSLTEWTERRRAQGRSLPRTAWAPEDKRYAHLTVMGDVARQAA